MLVTDTQSLANLRKASGEQLTLEELSRLARAVEDGNALSVFRDITGFTCSVNIRIGEPSKLYRYTQVNGPNEPTLFFGPWCDEYSVCSLNEAKAGKLTE